MSSPLSFDVRPGSIGSRDSWFNGPKVDSLGAGYPIQQSIFSGPLYLLLLLLEEKQLQICEVNLVSITSSYWNELLKLGRISPSSMCDFVDVATRLMALKARFLRPEVGVSPESDPDEIEEESLVTQLEQLKRFKSIVEEMSKRGQTGLHTYRRHVAFESSPSENLVQMEEPFVLYKALRRIASQLPRRQPSTLIPKPLFPIEDQIGKLVNALRNWKDQDGETPLSFFALFSARNHNAEFIAAFLAILELVRRRTISVSQEQQFGDIQLVPFKD